VHSILLAAVLLQATPSTISSVQEQLEMLCLKDPGSALVLLQQQEEAHNRATFGERAWQADDVCVLLCL
jgi:hypothetical protein